LSRAEAALRRIVSDLEGLSRRFALVGGLTVSARTEPRLTRDADLAVLVADDRDAESLVRDLQARRWRVVASVEQDAAGRLATVRLAPGDDAAGTVVDLLFASSGIEPEVVAAADRIDVLPRFAVPVARVGHLIALKVLARETARARRTASISLRSWPGQAPPRWMKPGRRSRSWRSAGSEGVTWRRP
jgi:hypothetical protein